MNDLERAYRAWKVTPAGQQAYTLCLRFAREKLARESRFGIAQLVERVRWEQPLPVDGDGDVWKLNNNHRAYIARDLIQDEPALEGLITIRKVREMVGVPDRRYTQVQ